jgi:lactate dehydrogenase-like 2-hydroxyacid dehydrogenase
VYGDADPDALERLEKFFELETVNEPLDSDALKWRLAQKAALLAAAPAKVNGRLLSGLPYLRAVCKTGPHHEDIDLDACTRAGIMATNTPDLGDGDIARHDMHMIAADNLIAAFGFGRIGGHPKNLLNDELRCMLGCCI